MVRTDVPYTLLKQNDLVDYPAGTPLDPVSQHVIVMPRVALPGPDDCANQLILFVTNTDVGPPAVDHTITVKAGVATASSYRGGTGDLTVTISGTLGGAFIGPLEDVRFAQADGSVYVDVEAAWVAGAIWAYMLPNRW